MTTTYNMESYTNIGTFVDSVATVQSLNNPIIDDLAGGKKIKQN